MMQDFYGRGAVVRSIAGRDRYRLYAVVGAYAQSDPGTSCVMIADGALHKLSGPKKKNLRHLAVLAAAPDGETSYLSSDSALKAFLEEFENKLSRD